jgi:hypothetical protein
VDKDIILRCRAQARVAEQLLIVEQPELIKCTREALGILYG